MAEPKTSKLHKNIKNYEKFFDGDFYKDIPQVYAGKRLSLDKNLQIIFIVIGSSGSGKDTIIDTLIKERVFHQVITATTRRRRYEFCEEVKENDRTKIASELDRLALKDFFVFLFLVVL